MTSRIVSKSDGRDPGGAAGDRKLARVLRRLAASGACIEIDGTDGHGTSYRLRGRDGAGTGDAAPADLVADALARGLLARKNAGPQLVLTRAGAQWLRRHMACDDDAFRAQHQARVVRPLDEKRGICEPAGASRPVLVNDAESPLAWLRRRKDRDGRPLLDAAEFEAGERLRADFTFAQLTPRVTASWDAAGGKARRGGAAGGGLELRDNVLAARQRVRRVLGAVGPELAGILLDVCCFLKGLEDVERELKLPPRSGKVLLRLALSSLARHYGLIGGGKADAIGGRLDRL